MAGISQRGSSRSKRRRRRSRKAGKTRHPVGLPAQEIDQRRALRRETRLRRAYADQALVGGIQVILADVARRIGH